jgi:hypothetical protein
MTTTRYLEMIMLCQSLSGLAHTALARALGRRTGSRAARFAAALAIASIFAPVHTDAADLISDGSMVRIRSTAIEAGWHTGRVKRDGRQCSMIQLDRPTQHGYTMVALMVVEALQLGRIGQWTAINPKQAIASEPAHCLVDGTD